MKKTIQLEPAAGQTKKLKDFICELLLKLIRSPDGTVAPTMLKMLILYRYAVAAGEKKDTLVTLPIALIPPAWFDEQDINGSGIACNSINEMILNWFATYDPVYNNGQIVFSATLYSVPSENELPRPIFVLDDAQLFVSEITDLPTGKKTIKKPTRTIRRNQRKPVNNSKINLQTS